MTNGWAHRSEQVGEVRLHWVEAGAGPTVVLLHGFPDFWIGWRRQIGPLVEAGFRVVAPDLRGYHDSARPRGVRAYAMARLLADVEGLIGRLGVDRVHLAGHDWGGVVAWQMAMQHPERVERLVILNAPHPAAFRRELTRSTQLLRSWYVAFFQLPLLPEWMLRRRRMAAIRGIFRSGPARRGAYSEGDIRAYAEAAGRPGALTAMLNYYRALLRYGAPPARTIAAPTLLLWGEQDAALSVNLTRGLERWVPDLRVERIPEASHWVMADAPERVNAAMVAFLTAAPG